MSVGILGKLVLYSSFPAMCVIYVYVYEWIQMWACVCRGRIWINPLCWSLPSIFLRWSLYLSFTTVSARQECPLCCFLLASPGTTCLYATVSGFYMSSRDLNSALRFVQQILSSIEGTITGGMEEAMQESYILALTYKGGYLWSKATNTKRNPTACIRWGLSQLTPHSSSLLSLANYREAKSLYGGRRGRKWDIRPNAFPLRFSQIPKHCRQLHPSLCGKSALHSPSSAVCVNETEGACISETEEEHWIQESF